MEGREREEGLRGKMGEEGGISGEEGAGEENQ